MVLSLPHFFPEGQGEMGRGTQPLHPHPGPPCAGQALCPELSLLGGKIPALLPVSTMRAVPREPRAVPEVSLQPVLCGPLMGKASDPASPAEPHKLEERQGPALSRVPSALLHTLLSVNPQQPRELSLAITGLHQLD